MNFTNWLSRWRLRRIIATLSYATKHGLREDVQEFAKSLEATALMMSSASMKKDASCAIQCTRSQLTCFIAYITALHSSKLSLIHRARIGLATLAISDKKVLGETPEEFVARELPKAKSSRRIITK